MVRLSFAFALPIGWANAHLRRDEKSAPLTLSATTEESDLDGFQTTFVRRANEVCRSQATRSLGSAATAAQLYLSRCCGSGSARDLSVGDAAILQNSLDPSGDPECQYPMVTDVSVPTQTDPHRHALRVVPRRYSNDACGVIIGIMTTAGSNRSSHRAALARTPSPCVQVVYVIGAKRITDTERSNLRAEQKAHRDLVLLDIKENMNNGKSHDWFKYAVENFPKAWLIGKGDMDTYIHVQNLFAQLEGRVPMTRNLYYGMDCMDNRLPDDGVYTNQNANMCGSLYFLGADLVKCAFGSPFGRSTYAIGGYEDRAVARVIFYSSCGVTYVSDQLRFFDIDGEWTRTLKGARRVLPLCLTDETVAVHMVKHAPEWKRINDWLSLPASKNGTASCMGVA